MRSGRSRGAIGTVLLLALVLAAVLGSWYAWRVNSSPAAEYTEKTALIGELNITTLSTGTVLPENRLEIKAPIAGRAETILVDEGWSVTKGQILAWMSSTERAALLDAAMAKGPKEQKRWEEFYYPTPILAPISGSVILRNIEPGQTFTAQDAVFVMSDRLLVKAQVDETDIALIELSQKAEIVLDAYPDSPIKARVLKIAFDAKTVNNVTTYDVDVIPDKIPDFMRSGMTANVSFFIKSKRDVLLIPSDAISISSGETFVLTRNGAQASAPSARRIQVGLSDGKMTEVLSGLSLNEKVYVEKPKTESAQGTNPFLPFSPKKGGGQRQ